MYTETTTPRFPTSQYSSGLCEIVTSIFGGGSAHGYRHTKIEKIKKNCTHCKKIITYRVYKFGKSLYSLTGLRVELADDGKLLHTIELSHIQLQHRYLYVFFCKRNQEI